MVTGVEEAVLGAQRVDGAGGELEGRRREPQLVEIDAEAVGAEDERAVQVDLGVVGVGEARPLAEAAIEPGTGLGEAPPVAGGGERPDGRVEVGGGHQQVDVTERPERGIGVVEVGHGRSLAPVVR